MNNNLILIKVKERLNKLDSQDYDNIETWKIQEAFNKAQLEFCRNQIHGNNQRKEGDESTKMLIDDMQLLLTEFKMNNLTPFQKYTETDPLPADYLWYKRLSCNSISKCCGKNSMTIYLDVNADVDNLLIDEFKRPSVEWGETFATLINNTARIYTNNEFEVGDVILTYYRLPRTIRFAGAWDYDLNQIEPVNVQCELKDDIIEIIVNDTVAILAGDTEMFNQVSRNKQSATLNN